MQVPGLLKIVVVIIICLGVGFGVGFIGGYQGGKNNVSIKQGFSGITISIIPKPADVKELEKTIKDLRKENEQLKKQINNLQKAK